MVEATCSRPARKAGQAERANTAQAIVGVLLDINALQSLCFTHFCTASLSAIARLTHRY